MSFDFRHLRAFVAVVDAGTVGRAAETLRISQPALSRLVRVLEATLGVALFERHTRGMQLTSFGEELLPRSRVLLAGAEDAAEDIAALRGAERDTAKVGALASAARTVLPPAMELLILEQPQIRVAVLEGVADTLLEALHGRSIDLVIAADLAVDDDIMRLGRPVGGDVTSVVARSGHPMAGRGTLAPADLAGVAWALPPRMAPPRRELERLLARHDVGPPDVRIETRAVDVLKASVARTDCLTWLPGPIYAAEERAGLLTRIDVAGIERRRMFELYRRRAGVLPAASSLLIAALRRLHPG